MVLSSLVILFQPTLKGNAVLHSTMSCLLFFLHSRAQMNVKDQKFSSGLILTNVLSAKIIKLRSKTIGFTIKVWKVMVKMQDGFAPKENDRGGKSNFSLKPRWIELFLSLMFCLCLLHKGLPRLWDNLKVFKRLHKTYLRD